MLNSVTIGAPNDAALIQALTGSACTSQSGINFDYNNDYVSGPDSIGSNVGSLLDSIDRG